MKWEGGGGHSVGVAIADAVWLLKKKRQSSGLLMKQGGDKKFKPKMTDNTVGSRLQ